MLATALETPQSGPAQVGHVAHSGFFSSTLVWSKEAGPAYMELTLGVTNLTAKS